MNCLFFVSLDKVFRNFVSEGRKQVYECFVRAKDRMKCCLSALFCFFKITCLKFLFCKIIGSYLFTKSGEGRQSSTLFLPYKNAQRLAWGTWDSIIAVIGDGAKSELAGVRKIFLLPL